MECEACGNAMTADDDGSFVCLNPECPDPDFFNPELENDQ